jgi:hypothetical protein
MNKGAGVRSVDFEGMCIRESGGRTEVFYGGRGILLTDIKFFYERLVIVNISSFSSNSIFTAAFDIYFESDILMY